MMRFDLSKILFYAVLALAVLGGSFSFGLYSAAEKTTVYKKISSLKNDIYSSTEIVAEESATLAKVHPEHFLQPARSEGEGVTVDHTDPDDDNLIFMAGFFEEDNQLRLIERDGTVVARWPVKFYDIFDNADHIKNPPATDWNIDTHGALALPDGSVVFNFEYGGLVKLDRCGNPVWILARETHHSIERAEKGGFWVPGRRHHTEESRFSFPPFLPPFKEDTILRVSEDGQILREISVPEIFKKNGLETLLTASGHNFCKDTEWDREILHLNKITELSSAVAEDFPMFEAGDLALSIRQSNLLMVVDPDTLKVKWWKIGPWIRQHDPEFKQGGTISLFNNNCYGTVLDPEHKNLSPLDAPRVTNIMEFDPVTNEATLVFGETPGQEMLSVVRGKHELTFAGGLLITEFEAGRVVETDKDGHVIWEYMNRYDEDEVAEITEARIYSRDYFNAVDWNDCDR